ncbi:MAG: nucleoside deaminase [Clostridia bacterium]|nr:nucleoside deaminase [Clostridia bacterium]
MIADFDRDFMREALIEAEKALALGEVPVGAVAVCDGRIVARAHNEREISFDPTAHAEVLALRRAAEALGTRRLSAVTLYVTLEPCAMCSGAIVAARLGRLVYGAADAQRGCCGILYRITEDPALDWFCPAEGGCLAEECAAMLTKLHFTGRE